MISGKKNVLGKLNFPGFQEILNFTATGSESSVSVTVDGDTDKEYAVVCRNLSTSEYVKLNFNSDTGANYGRQQLYNNAGTITAARTTGEATWYLTSFYPAMSILNILTPTGLIKTAYNNDMVYSSGTTMAGKLERGYSYNSTANVTSIKFAMSSGNFTAGTHIVVYARRSN